MPKIRTTINPTNEIEVDEREFRDLKAQGLVLEGTRATTPDGLTDAASRQVTGAAGDSSDKKE